MYVYIPTHWSYMYTHSCWNDYLYVQAGLLASLASPACSLHSRISQHLLLSCVPQQTYGCRQQTSLLFQTRAALTQSVSSWHQTSISTISRRVRSPYGSRLKVALLFQAQATRILTFPGIPLHPTLSRLSVHQRIFSRQSHRNAFDSSELRQL